MTGEKQMMMEIEEAESFFSELYCGKHHIPGKLKSFGEGWSINHFADLATFDFDTLTRLVFLAHDKCVRVSIQQSGPCMVKIILWKRKGRIGRMFERHPTIEGALDVWRTHHEKPDI